MSDVETIAKAVDEIRQALEPVADVPCNRPHADDGTGCGDICDVCRAWRHIRAAVRCLKRAAKEVK